MTPNEQEILNILRELKPFEEVRVVKDQLGRVDHFFVTRTQKIALSPTH